MAHRVPSTARCPAAGGFFVAGTSQASAPVDAHRLRSIYLDLVGRPPFRSERDRWLAADFRDLVDELIASDAFWSNWLDEQLYYFLLVDNFRPTTDSIVSMPSDLRSRKVGVREALHRIALSSAFERRNPGPDTYVTVVMEQLLGATVQKRPRELEIGKRIYDGARGNFLGQTGSSQADIVRFAIEDRQALRHFLGREYERLLRSEPTTRDLSGWVRALEDDRLAYASLVRGWILSPAYGERLASTRSISNRAFVRMLFVDLTDALPDAGDERRLQIALDGLADAGPLRSVIARLLIDSGKVALPERDAIADPTQWVRELFERFLGRSPSEEELTTFVSAFHDPACKPATVVYAIVSHPEYQTW